MIEAWNSPFLFRRFAGVKKFMIQRTQTMCVALFCVGIATKISCIYSVDLEVWSKLAKRARIKCIASKFARDFEYDLQRFPIALL